MKRLELELELELELGLWKHRLNRGPVVLVWGQVAEVTLLVPIYLRGRAQIHIQIRQDRIGVPQWAKDMVSKVWMDPT